MKKKLIFTSLILIAGVVVSLSGWAAIPAQAKQLSEINQNQSAVEETTTPGGLILLPAPAGGTLSPAESAALLYMREEEKLAHDVYVTMFQLWGLPIFQNIANAEQNHTEAIKTLLVRYGLPDPASSEIGVFTNPELQAMYTELIAQGEVSAIEALKVGVTIEEVDIQDLKTHLAETNKIDIKRVYNNLLRGSYNHLNAFTKQLGIQTGETSQVGGTINPNSQGGTQAGGYGRGFGQSARP